MHDQALQFLADHAPDGAKKVLDVGGRDINGSPRPLFPGAAYTALDTVDGRGVDVVADITTWDDMGKFDVVVCAEVLEHAANWRRIVEACWDRVKVGGVLLLTCATTGRGAHSAVDGGVLRAGEHYRNVSGGDMEKLLDRLGAADVTLEAHLDRGDLYVSARKRRGKGGASVRLVGESPPETWTPPRG